MVRQNHPPKADLAVCVSTTGCQPATGIEFRHVTMSVYVRSRLLDPIERRLLSFVFSLRCFCPTQIEVRFRLDWLSNLKGDGILSLIFVFGVSSRGARDSTGRQIVDFEGLVRL